MRVFGFKEGSFMISKGKKIFILVGMVVLLLVTGYLNIALNSSSTVEQTSTMQTSNFFTTYRADKQSTRDMQVSYYQSIVNTATDEEQKTEANAKIMEISAIMNTEILLEGKIMAAGFEDAIVTTSDGNYNVMVKSNGLTSSQVAKILSILVDETKVSATKVKVIPVE